VDVDEVSRRVAEQVAVDCAPGDVEDVLGRHSARRLLPLLRLAGDTGEAAGLVVLGERPSPARNRSHQLTTSDADRREGALIVVFTWRTRAYRALFDVLTGTLVARVAGSGAILSIEGDYLAAAALHDRPLGTAAARRAAEAAVRALLGQLRSALEHPGPPATSELPTDPRPVIVPPSAADRAAEGGLAGCGQ
jgi:hypothetical protein